MNFGVQVILVLFALWLTDFAASVIPPVGVAYSPSRARSMLKGLAMVGAASLIVVALR